MSWVFYWHRGQDFLESWKSLGCSLGTGGQDILEKSWIKPRAWKSLVF